MTKRKTTANKVISHCWFSLSCISFFREKRLSLTENNQFAGSLQSDSGETLLEIIRRARIMIQNNNKIAIIVGAGAVENAWTPVTEAFKLAWQHEVDIDGANFLFAKHIYLLRTYSKFKDALSVKNLKDEIELVNTLKELICLKIKQAQKEGIIKPRKEFVKILDKFVFSDMSNMFGLISTNWESVIDDKADEIVRIMYDDIESSKCFHIHGSIDTPNKLYLPSEISLENYRSDEENKEIGTNHYVTIDFFKQANQIIFYGISLDPLDAELSQILNAALNTSSVLKEIIIINPEYSKIKKRVELAIHPKTDVKIRCYIPENLDAEL